MWGPRADGDAVRRPAAVALGIALISAVSIALQDVRVRTSDVASMLSLLCEHASSIHHVVEHASSMPASHSLLRFLISLYVVFA